MSNSVHEEQLYLLIKNMPIWSDLQDLQASIVNNKQSINVLTKRLNRIDNMLNPTDDKTCRDIHDNNHSPSPSLTSRSTLENEELSKLPIGHYFSQTNVSQEQNLDFSISMLKKRIGNGTRVYFFHRLNEPWKVGHIRNMRLRKKVVFISVTMTGCQSSMNEEYECKIYEIARKQHHGNNLQVGKRVIAGKNLVELFPGTIVEVPSQMNKLRYMIFYDNGKVDYVSPSLVAPILGQSLHPWMDLLRINPNPLTRNLSDHIAIYLHTYPNIEYKNVSPNEIIAVISLNEPKSVLNARVVDIDCHLLKIEYEDQSTEMICSGGSRLDLENCVASDLFKSKLDIKMQQILKTYHNVIYPALDLQELDLDDDEIGEYKNTYFCRAYQIAKKSTTKSLLLNTKQTNLSLDSGVYDEEEVVVITREHLDQSAAHNCDSDCLYITNVKTEIYVQNIRKEFRDCSDLQVPLKLGWRRYLSKIPSGKKTTKLLMAYETPCKKILTSNTMIYTYLRRVGSQMDISYFCLDHAVKLNRLKDVSVKPIIYIPDLSLDAHGNPQERKPVCLVNTFSTEKLPTTFSYRAETVPINSLAKQGFTFNCDFKSGCQCAEDCNIRADCECHEITDLAFGSTLAKKLKQSCQYRSKRLYKIVRTGIFECNSFCRCSYKCPNRVVQNGIAFRLQIQKTLRKGWGVITLDDIPNGGFICTYTAELLDDADKYGSSDTYYADLDFITVNENEKEKLNDDINSDEGLDFTGDDEEMVIEENFEVRLPRQEELYSNNKSDTCQLFDCSSENSDEIQRYPKRDMTKICQNVNKEGIPKPKFRKIHDVLGTHDFTLDAKRSGNVGRFLNHSCDPNCFAQNVFINTHDLRFPTVAFFAKRPIRAMEEITWNYNYSLGSIPGRSIQCNCDTLECRGRLL